ncbi:class I lanthipeptide [Kordia sp.]|uniref:class I lanthipeptide n=1 Tax=Kordia sp. TaxID=1965332 RepID=UPI003D27FC23
MKKKNLKTLNLNKESISKLENENLKGGWTTKPTSPLVSWPGLSCDPLETCGNCY